ncbi:MAG: TetR family transcriptional regulator [Spongiibacteraceae bacterium]|jgi:AcrR family transcriptional regulator|nr:TetR family transcriptional regulator [Spongiibacteraceae bacterium]
MAAEQPDAKSPTKSPSQAQSSPRARVRAPAKTKPNRAAAQTRERLLDAAERLFAERGIDNVTLLDVTRAAGQGNRSALQYHFGDKPGLLNAVLDRHAHAIARKRQRMLDKLAEQGDSSLRDVVAALVVPVADRYRHGGEAYLQLNSQLMASHHWSEFRLQRADLEVATRRFQERLADLLPALPKAELAARLLLMDVMLFHGLATYASRAPRPGFARFTQSLVDAISAMLSRPQDATDPAG